MNRLIGVKVLVLVLTLVLVVAITGCSSDDTPPPVSQSDNLAPDFQLESLEGQVVTLSGLRGKPVMLNFWASWCGPCRGEMPFIQAVFEDEKWTEQGLEILAINIGESASEAQEFMEDNDLSFTVLLDTDASVADDYGIRGIPTTFFIDENGIIKDGKTGAFSNKAEIDWRLVNSILVGE